MKNSVNLLLETKSAHALANPPAPPYASAGASNFDTLGLTTSAGKTRRALLNNNHTHTQQPRPRPGSVRRQAHAVAATPPHHTPKLQQPPRPSSGPGAFAVLVAVAYYPGYAYA